MKKLITIVSLLATCSVFAEDIDLTAEIRAAYESDHSLVTFSDSGRFDGTVYTPFDGLTTARWLSAGGATTAWIQLEVSDSLIASKGGKPVVKSFKFNVNQSKTRRPEYFIVQVSDDGTNWSEAYRQSTGRVVWTDNCATFDIPEPAAAKYIRFYFLKERITEATYHFDVDEIYLYGVFGSSNISECKGLTDEGVTTEAFLPRYFEGADATLTAPQDFTFGGISHSCTGYRLETSTDGGETWGTTTSSDKSVTLPIGSTLYRVTWLWRDSKSSAEVDLTAEFRTSYGKWSGVVVYSDAGHYDDSGAIDTYTPFDGYTSQRWLSSHNEHTSWLQVHFKEGFADGKVPSLTRVRLSGNNSSRRPVEMTLKVSDDAENWTTIATVASALTWTDNIAEFEVTGTATGRYIRLDMTNNSNNGQNYWYDLEEVYFYGIYPSTAKGLVIIYR